jgi:hypothetical protein
MTRLRSALSLPLSPTRWWSSLDQVRGVLRDGPVEIDIERIR